MAQKKDNRTTTQSDVSDFPLHAFPKKILEMANGLADSESFHIEYLLVSMVSAIASATGNALQIRIKGGWTSSPIFYIILVGRPGLGKTPPLDFAYRPIRAYDFQNLSKFRDYNPTNKTVNLSEDVYGNDSIMAAAVAAHECGHAVQHARMYAPLKMRSALVPVVNFASSIMTWILLVGILLVNTFPQLLLAGIILFAMTTLFSFITLPVEINASKRALVWLSSSGITNSYNHAQAEDALRSAAYTYVVAALSSLATLVYYIMIFMGRRD